MNPSAWFSRASLLAFLVCGLGLISPAASAQPAPDAVEAAAAPEADAAAMLRSCDAQLRACETSSELCEKDRSGVGFLGAAYIALWVILMAFFFMVRARQRALVKEMKTLRERLSRAQGEV